MKLFRKINNRNKFVSFKSLFLLVGVFYNLTVIGSENKSEVVKIKYGDNQFEKIYFQNSIQYNEYDKSTSQFKSFFGYEPDQSENAYYPDLSIINDSDNIREIYRSKLNDMTINKIIYNIE